MPPLVSNDQVIARVPAAAALGSDDLTLIIEANEILLRQRVGTIPPWTMRVFGQQTILLPMQVDTINSITEHWINTHPSQDIILDQTDWRLGRDRTSIFRLEDGANARLGFADEVIIDADVADMTALWQNVLIQLCAIDVNTTGKAGVARERLGDHEVDSGTGQAAKAPSVQKEDILAQLISPLPVFW
jgi:hypothetical protein